MSLCLDLAPTLPVGAFCYYVIALYKIYTKLQDPNWQLTRVYTFYTIVDMMTFNISQKMGVKRTDTPQSLSIIQNAYGGDGGSKRVSRNYHLRKEQEVLIRDLAEHHGETKVTVLRAIIDEWRELKLRDHSPIDHPGGRG